MVPVRWADGRKTDLEAPCDYCQADGCPWDRIGKRVVCPDCQAQLVRGEGEPLTERLSKNPCALCAAAGTVIFLTYPLPGPQPVMIDLCPGHLRGLMARRLGRMSFRSLSRQLQAIGLAARQVFLLHEAFYDASGMAIMPLKEE